MAKGKGSKGKDAKSKGKGKGLAGYGECCYININICLDHASEHDYNAAWGGQSDGYEWPQDEDDIHITRNVTIMDSGTTGIAITTPTVRTTARYY